MRCPGTTSTMNRISAVLVAGLLACGCVTAQFERDNRLRPVADEEIGRLVPGEAKLEECLAVLGAPLFVRERQTYGAELAYGWYHQRDWGVRVSVPVSDYTSASFNYDDIDAKLRGAVLLFDEDWKLEVVRTGYLRELVARKVTPAYLDDDETGATGAGGP